MDALEVIKSRRSVRSYVRGEVKKEVIEALVDAGRLAATARNEQPWEFIAVTQPETLEKLSEVATYGKFIRQAAAAIVVYCAHSKYEIEDGCAATQNILLAAWAHGLGSCWVNGTQATYADEVSTILGVPRNYRLISLIPLGNPAAVPQLEKRGLGELLHWEKF